MATLLSVENRVREMESLVNSDDATVQSGIRAAINEGLDALYEDRAWWWTDTTATVSANGDGNLVLPEETTHVLSVYGSTNEPLLPRPRSQQLDYRAEITNKAYKTYALGGYDSTTGFPILTLWPSGSGSYEVRYQPAPAELTADADVIPGPRSVAHYLAYYARWIRLHADEERLNLRQEAQGMMEYHKRRLVRSNALFLESLPHMIHTGA